MHSRGINSDLNVQKKKKKYFIYIYEKKEKKKKELLFHDIVRTKKESLIESTRDGKVYPKAMALNVEMFSRVVIPRCKRL